MKNYELLRDAIIAKAIDDYVALTMHGKVYPADDTVTVESLESFFANDCNGLLVDLPVSGDELLELAKRRIRRARRKKKP